MEEQVVRLIVHLSATALSSMPSIVCGLSLFPV